MKKLALFLIGGLLFGLVSIANAVHQLPEFMQDLNRWLGRDYSYYQQRWDPRAERFARFEDRFRHRVEDAYQNGTISYSEYQHLRTGLVYFDDALRGDLSDGRLSWREQRDLENRQEHLRNDLRASLESGESGSHYENPYPYYGTNPYYRDYDRD